MIAQNMLEREECARGMEIAFQEEGNQNNALSVVEISDDGEEGEQMIEIKITLITSSWGERRWKGGGASGEQVTNPEQ